MALRFQSEVTKWWLTEAGRILNPVQIHLSMPSKLKRRLETQSRGRVNRAHAPEHVTRFSSARRVEPLIDSHGGGMSGDVHARSIRALVSL